MDTKVGQFDKITCLKRKPDSAKALELLNMMATQVEVLMKRRGWKVGLLKEMYPKNPNLLGLNYGKTVSISIRLRLPYKESEFLPYTSLLVYGPHDQKFYSLLGQLKDEFEDLMLKEVYSTGFKGEGKKLGSTAHNPYHFVIKEESSTKAQPFSGKGFRLGSSPNKTIKNSQPTILDYFSNKKGEALAANPPVWCSNDNGLKLSSSTNAKRPLSSIIVISDNEEEDNNVPPGPQGNSWSCPSCTCENPPLILQCLVCLSIRPTPKLLPETPENWQCSFCTLLNSLENKKCSVCDNLKDQNESVSISSTWVCSSCTLINQASEMNCAACLASAK